MQSCKLLSSIPKRSSFKRFPLQHSVCIYCLHCSNTSGIALGPIQPPIQLVPRALSLGVKWPERESDHSPLVPRSRIRGTTPPLHQYVFMAWCSVEARGQLYLSFTVPAVCPACKTFCISLLPQYKNLQLPKR
jgi:hypothetical protein